MTESDVVQRRRVTRGVHGLLVPVIVAACVLGAWWIAALIIDNPAILATPASTWTSLHTNLLRHHSADIIATIQRVGGAVGIGIPGGAILGILIAETAPADLRDRIAALGGTLLGTPKFIFLPVFLLLLGQSYWETVTYALIDGVVIMMIGASAAVATVSASAQWSNLCRALGMSRLQRLRYLVVPYAAPTLLEAVRLSVALVVSGVLLSEMYLADKGVGVYIIGATAASITTADVLAGVVFMGALAVVINELFHAVERRVGRWR
jgi:sulfonate transport system permease protein